MGIENSKKYTFSLMFGSEIEPSEKMEAGLVEGEAIEAAYKAKANNTLGILTNKRILYRGLLFGQPIPFIGKEINIYTIPYSSIDLFSSEFSDTTLLNAFKHFNIWTKGGQEISLLFSKDTDIKKVREIIANGVLV